MDRDTAHHEYRLKAWVCPEYTRDPAVVDQYLAFAKAKIEARFAHGLFHDGTTIYFNEKWWWGTTNPITLETELTVIVVGYVQEER
jgi:hypothetical protein